MLKRLKESSSFGIPYFDNRRNTAEETFSKSQLAIIATFPVALLIGSILGVKGIMVWGMGTLTVLYFFGICFRALLLVNSHKKDSIYTPTLKEIASLKDCNLPKITILAPNHNEKEQTLRGLINCVSSLEWPQDKLEVILLIRQEADDMLSALDRIGVPDNFRILKLGPHYPKNKASALNIGLAEVTGRQVIIYDSESRPEPQQLKKMWLAYLYSPADVVAISAIPVVSNPYASLVSGWFAAEYTSHYSDQAPGLARLGLPTPLSGHSVMLSTAVLRSIGGWDPFCVAEDCNLGIMLSRAGRRVRYVNSETKEEAPTNPIKWIRQRARWIKGFIQTYMVHMRSPMELIKNIGITRFLAFQATIGMVPLTNVVNPIFWTTTTAYILTRSEFIQSLYSPIIVLIGMLTMLAGTMMLLVSLQNASAKRGEYKNIKWMFLVPIYWTMMVIACFVGVYDLLKNPHSWGAVTEKSSEENNNLLTTLAEERS